MSYEYVCQIRTDVSSAAVLEEVVGALSSRPDYVLLNAGVNKALLKYADSELRPEWPEDIVIDVADAAIRLTVYSGSRLQRENFVSLVTEILSSMNLPCVFEEI
jgi:hypothetical protein